MRPAPAPPRLALPGCRRRKPLLCSPARLAAGDYGGSRASPELPRCRGGRAPGPGYVGVPVMVWPSGVGRRSRALVGDRRQQGGRESAARRSYSGRHVAAQAPAQAASSPVRTAGGAALGTRRLLCPGDTCWGLHCGVRSRAWERNVWPAAGKPRVINFQQRPLKSHIGYGIHLNCLNRRERLLKTFHTVTMVL